MAGRITISTLNDDTGVLATQNGMSGIAKAWVNFNGTGTPAIRASMNVGSITKNGTGDFTVNFTTAMPDANYSVQTSFQTTGVGTASNIFSSSFSGTAVPATTSYRVAFWATANGAGVDPAYICSAIFR
jgi:hypothetical protein